MYRACASGQRDESRGSGRGNLETRETSVVIEGLNAFSEYELEVKALPPAPEGGAGPPPPPEELKMRGETRPGLPEARPAESSIAPRVKQTSLKLYWQSPAPSDCVSFNGPLDGFFYTLKGVDVWNAAEEYSGTTRDTSKNFPGLRPFSTYALFLYAQTRDGEHNERVYLKQVLKTSEGVPLPPRALEDESGATGDKENRRLRWLPPFPPTGEVHFYTLRWKEANASQWLGKDDVHPSDDLCAAEAAPGAALHERPVCHVVTGLDADKEYRFQLAAWNRAVSEHSSWTQEVVSEAGSFRVLGLGESALLIVVIASVAGILFLLLCAAVCSYQCHKRRSKSKYKNVPAYEPGRRPVPSFNGSVMTDRSTLPPPYRLPSRQTSNASDTMKRYQLHLLPLEDRASRTASIQEQPLPEVPREEPLYEELKVQGEEEPDGAKAGDQTDEEEFLKPKEPQGEEEGAAPEQKPRRASGDSLDEDDYLPPRKLRNPNASSDTIDLDDYLKPTFGRFDRINSRDLSPPSEAPPPIPTVSYEQVKKN